MTGMKSSEWRSTIWQAEAHVTELVTRAQERMMTEEKETGREYSAQEVIAALKPYHHRLSRLEVARRHVDVLATIERLGTTDETLCDRVEELVQDIMLEGLEN